MLSMTNLDGIMEQSKHYHMDEHGRVTSARGSSQPFEAKTGHCPKCRHRIQNVQRYNRIWRRALLDVSTKRFIAWSTAAFVPLSERLDRIEEILNGKASVDVADGTRGGDMTVEQRQITLSGSFDNIIKLITKIKPAAERYSSVLRVRKDIQRYLDRVTEDEQPFGRIRSMMESIRIQERQPRSVQSQSQAQDNTILQSKQRIMATSLRLRCDVVILTDFFEIRRSHNTKFTTKYDWRAVELKVDFGEVYEACTDLAGEAEARTYPMVQVEALLYFIRLVALDRSSFSSAESISNPTFNSRMKQARELLEQARAVCAIYPGSTPGMLDELEAAEKMLKEETFYESVTNEEKRQIIQAMRKEFQVNGHWYVFIRNCSCPFHFLIGLLCAKI